MFNSLVKVFIKDYDHIDDLRVREKYGTLCSVLSIICNMILVISKCLFAFVINSSALMADGLNNLSDIGSNVASLIGFKLSSIPPDKDHPYGHGRIEYISGLVISFLILLIGASSLKESIVKIINPEVILFEMNVVIMIIIAIIIKLWMYSFNKYTGTLINSVSLKAASQDSLNDVVTTSVTFISLIVSQYTSLPVDGIFGVMVSLMIIYTGIETFKDTSSPLIGKAPDHQLIDQVYEIISHYDKIIGVHDVMFHDYGPERMFMSFHAEVDSHQNIVDVHEQIDLLERALREELNIMTAIHIDPVDIDDDVMLELKQRVEDLVNGMNSKYSIHDFRITHNVMMFDVLIPFEDKQEHDIIKNKIINEMNKWDLDYKYDINVEHAYI